MFLGGGDGVYHLNFSWWSSIFNDRKFNSTSVSIVRLSRDATLPA